jgi:hypothetical protein
MVHLDVHGVAVRPAQRRTVAHEENDRGRHYQLDSTDTMIDTTANALGGLLRALRLAGFNLKRIRPR